MHSDHSGQVKCSRKRRIRHGKKYRISESQNREEYVHLRKQCATMSTGTLDKWSPLRLEESLTCSQRHLSFTTCILGILGLASNMVNLGQTHTRAKLFKTSFAVVREGQRKKIQNL